MANKYIFQNIQKMANKYIFAKICFNKYIFAKICFKIYLCEYTNDLVVFFFIKMRNVAENIYFYI